MNFFKLLCYDNAQPDVKLPLGMYPNVEKALAIYRLLRNPNDPLQYVVQVNEHYYSPEQLLQEVH